MAQSNVSERTGRGKSGKKQFVPRDKTEKKGKNFKGGRTAGNSKKSSSVKSGKSQRARTKSRNISQPLRGMLEKASDLPSEIRNHIGSDEKSGSTRKPSGTHKSDGTRRSSSAGKSDGTRKPSGTHKSDGTRRSSSTGKSDGTRRSSSAGKSSGMRKSEGIRKSDQMLKTESKRKADGRGTIYGFDEGYKEAKRKVEDQEKNRAQDSEKSHGLAEIGESDINQDVSWSQQVSSIVFGVLALFMFALIIFKGDNLWTVMHNFIFGLFGNMAILWNALLVYSGYMFAKQKGAMRILEITRSAAGIIIFIDVLNYILIQSNGYRNVYNELTYGIFDLAGQIYNDGSRLGGTGLIGGVIGEILLRLLGKTGGSIVCILVLFGLCMLISHTTPVALIERMRDGFSNGWNIITAMFRYEIPKAIKHAIHGEGENLYSLSDGEYSDNLEYTDDADDPTDSQIEYSSQNDDIDDIFTATYKPSDNLSKHLNEELETDSKVKQGLADISVGDLMKKVTQKKKKKTKAEEVQEQKEEFAKQVAYTESSDKEELEDEEYKYPTLRLLIATKISSDSDSRQGSDETAEKLINTLAEYGVKASVSHVSCGPTVTRYEINPAPGVKINKITNLSNDIALRLAAQSIRIEAPIPGKSAVGIEIPNKNKQMVRIREIIGSREFAEAKGSLMVALGKDIEGNIVLCDLSKMPHLLIAGSTGSGKSVCVNSMLISLLYKYSPKEVRMVLIDPKSVEFDMYNGIPHLLVPVVCEPKKAAGALQWAVSEMLKRYGMLKERGARNIDNYNRMSEETGEFEKLCRIVIVIDEMADLMIASPKEVEDAIARLAAMARAAGMYMVLATQRPSVDVITGTIKNNIPSRIALAVSSQIDSRTILDEGGAENLIGYGDMLYHPMGSSKHTRVQGCFVDDAEVDRVIKFIKQNGSAEYDDSIADEIERNSMEGGPENSADFSDKDEFFEKAVEIVTEAGQASTSMLQRRLGVGYARAGRIIDQLEEQGIIGPYEGSKPRAVLITRTQWLEMTMSKIPSGKNDPIVRSHSQFAAQTLDNGHEEITARQSEFFNADEEEDDYIYYDSIEDCDNETANDIEVEYTEEQGNGDALDADDDSGDREEHCAPYDEINDFDNAEITLPPTGNIINENTIENNKSTVQDDENDNVIEDNSEDIEELPQVRDFTEFFSDSMEDEAGTELTGEETADRSAEDGLEDIRELPQVRDFTEFFSDSMEDEAGTELTGEETLDRSAEDGLEDIRELPQVRDFTEFFSDSVEDEAGTELTGEETLDRSAEDGLEDIRELPQVRDFTEFFSGSVEDKSKKDVTAKELDDSQIDYNSGDVQNIDLPPWDDPIELSEEVPLRHKAEKISSKDNVFDDDDELYNDILSSSWVKRLDDKK